MIIVIAPCVSQVSQSAPGLGKQQQQQAHCWPQLSYTLESVQRHDEASDADQMNWLSCKCLMVVLTSYTQATEERMRAAARSGQQSRICRQTFPGRGLHNEGAGHYWVAGFLQLKQSRSAAFAG
jgi:hypothetical protein